MRAIASLFTVAAALAAAAIIPSAGAQTAADTVGWTIEGKDGDPGRVQLSLTRKLPRGQWMHSNTVSLSDLGGVTAAQLADASGAPVAFRIVRHAGTLECEGIARRGRGTGECAFRPDRGFVSALSSRGVGTATDQQLFSLAMGNIGLDFVDELDRQKYARPTVDDLIRAGDHGARLDYLRLMGGLGYRVGTLSALIEMRDHGVTADFVSDLVRHGVRDISAGDLVRLRDHGVSPAFVGEMRTLGYSGLGVEQLIRLRDHGVSASYVRELADHGIKGMAPELLVRLRDHGVSASFVGEMSRLGYNRFGPSDLIRLRDHGVSADYVRELSALGYTGLSADEIVRLRTHDVRPDFIRRANQPGRRSPEELVRLRIGS